MNDKMHQSSYKADCLEGKVALLSGGGSGIGKGIASTFLDHGCDVAILSRSMPRLEAAAEELRRSHPSRKVLPVSADVRNLEQVNKAVQKVIEELGYIDILVNGAAGNFLVPADSISSNAFRTVIEIDTIGTFHLSQSVYKHCFSVIDQKSRKYRGGRIINISMTLHYSGTLMQAHAGVAKAGVDSLTKHLAVEWGPVGVRVNGIAPGAVADTEGNSRLSVADSGGFTLDDCVPAKRIGTKADIGAACVFLSIDDSEFVTGTTLVVDGGSHLVIGNHPILSKTVREAWNRGDLKSIVKGKL